MDQALKSLKAVSDVTRVRLLLLLMEREACVCELMAVFGMAQSKLSHHLLMLRDTGFLEGEKRGKWNYYRLKPTALNRFNKDLLSSLSKNLVGESVITKDRKSLQEVKKRMKICC